MSNPQPQKFNWLPLGLLALLIVVLGGLYALRGDQPTRPSDFAKATTEDDDSKRRDKARSSSVTGTDSGKSKFGDSTKSMGDFDSSGTATSANADETSTPPERTTEDPMGYVVHDFRNHQMQLTDFKLDNVVLTEDGITLGPAGVDEATTDGSPTPRVGTFESPPLALVAASNLVAPNWKEKLPANANVQIELSCSADQNEWTEWFPISRSDDEVSPTYPDGAPNPNYGNTPGTHVAFGLHLYPYARYRVTLAASGVESPVFQQIRLYHTDGTGGNGVLANQMPDTPAEPPPAPAPAPTNP
jgi:hypothetical protein